MGGIDAIEALDIEAAEASFAAFAHIVRLAADAPALRILRVADNAKFRCNHDAITPSTNGFADKFLVCMGP